MEIIEYEDKYIEDVRDLLVELEEYILSIDKDELDQIHPEYREKMALISLEAVKNKNGKCFIAVDNNKAIGLIMGTIREYDEYDYLDYKCPKMGEVTELIVSNKARKNGIGKQLMEKLEKYFKEQNCLWEKLDVFAYNENAIKFYEKQIYHPRMYVDIKKLDK